MKKNGRRELAAGMSLLAAFLVWTMLIQCVDVKPVGVRGTEVGFATWNCWFHNMTGVHMELYVLTDWLGLIPVFVCILFGGLGFTQMLKRKSLFRVDHDIIFLGIYYTIVIFCYLLFEMYPVNYRPLLIEGRLEASYPSSTTLLVLCVMPTLTEQLERRLENVRAKNFTKIVVICFSAGMVMGRLISGVHWFTDIFGAVLFGQGLFLVYKGAVSLRRNTHGIS